MATAPVISSVTQNPLNAPPGGPYTVTIAFQSGTSGESVTVDDALATITGPDGAVVATMEGAVTIGQAVVDACTASFADDAGGVYTAAPSTPGSAVFSAVAPADGRTAATGTATITDPVTALSAEQAATLTFAGPPPTPPPPVTARAMFGASLGPVGSAHPSIAQWASASGLPLSVRHVFASTALWPSYAASPFNGEAKIRKILLDLELAKDGSDAAGFDRLLASCAAAGLVADLTIYHAAPSKGFSGPAAYWAALAHYVPLIYKYPNMRHVFDLTSYQIVHDGNLPTWYPGPGGNNPNPCRVSAIGVEYYDPGFHSGQRLDDAAAYAAKVGVPFGLAEFGMQYNGAPGGGTCSEATGLAMLKYVYGLYAGMIAAGRPVYDCVLWSDVTGNTAPGWIITNQPRSWLAGSVAQPGYREIAALLAGTGKK